MKKIIISGLKLIRDFFSENGQGSSKRWIAISSAAVLMWMLVYATMKAANASERFALVVADMVFIFVLLGLATLPQIISFFKGTPIKDEPPPPPPPPTTTTTTTTETKTEP